jgi:hypothetical protein
MLPVPVLFIVVMLSVGWIVICGVLRSIDVVLGDVLGDRAANKDGC